MNAKKADKIATGILYAVSGVIVLILAALLIYILARGIPPIKLVVGLVFSFLTHYIYY